MALSYVGAKDAETKIWENLAEWDNLDDPLAPLTGTNITFRFVYFH